MRRTREGKVVEKPKAVVVEPAPTVVREKTVIERR